MITFMPRVAIAALGVLIACACDAPWDGPTMPTGSHSVSFKVVSDWGPAATQVGILAATSVASLRSQVLAGSLTNHIQNPCAASMQGPDPCWTGAADDLSNVYLAVTNVPVCYRTVKESAALNDRHLDFIYWIGKPQRSCNLALALPHWRLIAVPRSELSGPGSYEVQLQIQEAGATQTIGTQLVLS